MKLNDLMSMDHVVQVHADGTVTDGINGIHAPELCMGCNSDGQILAAHETEYLANARSQGWEILTNWSGQWSYHGLVMHPSEYIGGALEKHIRETPGYWAAIIVTCDDREDAGWALAYREAG